MNERPGLYPLDSEAEERELFGDEDLDHCEWIDATDNSRLYAEIPGGLKEITVEFYKIDRELFFTRPLEMHSRFVTLPEHMVRDHWHEIVRMRTMDSSGEVIRE